MADHECCECVERLRYTMQTQKVLLEIHDDLALEKQRDAWRSMAEQLAQAILRGNVHMIDDAIQAFDRMVADEGSGAEEQSAVES